jgi:hypothetical protein
MRPAADRDARGVADARAMLDTAYDWLERTLANREWAAGDHFSLADCGAAPFLFYADWTHRIDASFAHVIAYRQRLLARPSFARAVDEARPFRRLFPLGAPDRDRRRPPPPQEPDHDSCHQSCSRHQAGTAQPHAPAKRKQRLPPRAHCPARRGDQTAPAH